MKRAAVILPLMFLVLVQTPVGQVLKLPLLIEHYLKHQAKESTSVSVFFKMHYATNHRDADWPEDQQLPFKNINFNSIGFALVTPIIQPAAVAVLPADEQFPALYTYSPQQHLASIFHPPRM